MTKTYILAPNWTTAPPPDGPLRLGHILTDLTEFIPLNRRGRIEIPPEDLNKIDVKDGFQSSRSTLVSGELGFVAKVIGILGVGAGASIYYKKDKNDVLACSSVETMTFDPTADYINKSMELPEVSQYIKGSRFKQPVYMVTGFKIGRGCSLQSSSSSARRLRLNGGLIPPGNSADIEGTIDFSKEVVENESWEGSTDFIIAFRVRKLWYLKRAVQNKAYNKGVVMEDDRPLEQAPDIHLRTSDEIVQEDVSMNLTLSTGTSKEADDMERWILPVFTQK